MNVITAIEVLEKHQEWRRDTTFNPEIKTQDPTEIGNAIDYALTELRKLNRKKLPSGKEIEEAAESFGNLYGYNTDYANGCEAGWKAGSRWMKEKYEDFENEWPKGYESD